ncbi:carbon-nitrogen hydrolase family protein [Thiohalobacter thiocyanaticus]|uniref:Carbon-nitrogen hydrolase family protein n=1 Tax=Thiohalobacter thiocyanaticus TaxID=585455 RepID=A0A426QHP0_9GAMM|nr:carbon-nitrogen hydrolase family protein [Thiohalobacter thiocyanaticus]RRQ21250.1 carbon-nitrogen hydrolase family protein [Thiohalobacter thiocyanaticus]
MTQVASIQMASGPNVNANLLEAERMIEEAAKRGAELVVLPENFAIMGIHESDKVEQREASGEGPIQEFLARQARRHRLWLVGGTVPLQADAPDKIRAACLLINPEGERVARYDKMHLFDVEVVGSGEKYTESETIEPGNDITVVDTPFGRLGLSVCYDLRFPELYRVMLDRGVEILAVPSAFTALTGKAHWDALVRSRAIENLCYVIASAQGGYHLNGRETYGNSMIVDPWGTVLERLPRGTGVIMAKLDRGYLESTRRLFPSIEHRRIKCGPL